MKLFKIVGLTSFVLMINFVSFTLSAQQIKHVVLISLDGSRPEFYMDKSWPAPHLQNLKKEGAYASEGIEGIFPSVTWPSHTSIITGANPDQHGVFYNSPFGANPGHNYWYYSYIKTKTLFDAVKKAGMTSGAVWWPVLVGAPVNYNFPVRRPEKGEVGNKLTIRYPYIRPENLLSDIEKELGKKFVPADLEFENNAQGKFVAKVSSHIIKKYKPNFVAIHFGEIDHASHGFGTESPQTKNAVQFNDSLVGIIIDAIKDAGIMDSTAIIITGDHGHSNVNAIFKPNIYLEREGLISDYCWQAKFNTAGGSTFLHLNKSEDTATMKKVVTVLKNSPEYKKGLFRILDSKMLKEKGANPNTPIALAMKEGVQASNDTKGSTLESLKPPFRSTHGYDPAYASMNTMFLAVGKGIKHTDVKSMKMVDLAPFIAELLGLDFAAPDGQLVPGIISGN